MFALTPNTATGKWMETVLYSFCGQHNCADGHNPYGSLIMDGRGTLYGTTWNGGARNSGTVFALIPSSAEAGWTQSVLYNFCAQGSGYCPDGTYPYAGLIMDGRGTLYGTTYSGGVQGLYREGVVFSLTPNADKSKWSESVLYSFCSGGQVNCTDGAEPVGDLTVDPSGHLYGVTRYGGNGWGAVFSLAPNTDKSKWTETVLYRFCAEIACIDGALPMGGVIRDAKGRLYGATFLGGANMEGTIFALP